MVDVYVKLLVGIEEPYIDYYRDELFVFHIGEVSTVLPRYELEITETGICGKYIRENKPDSKMNFPQTALNMIFGRPCKEMKLLIDSYNKDCAPGHSFTKSKEANILLSIWIGYLYYLPVVTNVYIKNDHNNFLTKIITPDMGNIHNSLHYPEPDKTYYELICDNNYNLIIHEKDPSNILKNTVVINTQKISQNFSLENSNLEYFLENKPEFIYILRSDKFCRTEQFYRIVERMVNRITFIQTKHVYYDEENYFAEYSVDDIIIPNFNERQLNFEEILLELDDY